MWIAVSEFRPQADLAQQFADPVERLVLRLAGEDIDRDINIEDVPTLDAVKEA